MKLKNLPDSISPDLDLKRVKRECKQLVKKRAYVSAGAAIIPIPFADVVVDAGILSQLLPEISERFGLSEGRMDAISLEQREIHWQEMRSRAFEFAGLVASRGVVKKSIQSVGGKVAAKQVTKFIPLGGQIVAASLGYATMRKIAFDHIDECYRLASQIQNKHVVDAV